MAKTRPHSFLFDRIATPTGELIIVADADGYLCGIDWADNEARLKRLLNIYHGPSPVALVAARDPRGLSKAMRAYFRGAVDAIDALPVRMAGTDFQNTVWRALRRIPAGATTSYAELARRVRRPSAVRAVGTANGANPISVVVPCHRLIGSNGSLTGYGGGIARKRWLLDHEGARLDADRS